MPNIGEIRRQKRNDGNGYTPCIWAACVDCGKERWVQISGGKLRRNYCHSCGLKRWYHKQSRLGENSPNWRGGKIKKICQSCGKQYEKAANAAEASKYCSKECLHNGWARSLTGEKNNMWKGGKVGRTCKECGNEFGVFPYIIDLGYGNFCSNRCAMVYNRKQGKYCQTPNKAEQTIIDLISENNLPFRFSGNGDVWFGNRNPDFINTNGKKQVIELLGTYWHPLFDGADRTEHYKQYGFDCLVIWEDELKNEVKLTKKMREFGLNVDL